jgi:hypothetical protein
MTKFGFVGLMVILSATITTPIHATAEARMKPWPAPVGHRQPHAAEVPASPSTQTLDQEDVIVDRKISNICRGCIPQHIDAIHDQGATR